MVRPCDPSTQGAEIEIVQIQSQLGYYTVRPSLNKKVRKLNSHFNLTKKHNHNTLEKL